MFWGCGSRALIGNWCGSLVVGHLTVCKPYAAAVKPPCNLFQPLLLQFQPSVHRYPQLVNPTHIIIPFETKMQASHQSPSDLYVNFFQDLVTNVPQEHVAQKKYTVLNELFILRVRKILDLLTYLILRFEDAASRKLTYLLFSSKLLSNIVISLEIELNILLVYPHWFSMQLQKGFVYFYLMNNFKICASKFEFQIVIWVWVKFCRHGYVPKPASIFFWNRCQ